VGDAGIVRACEPVGRLDAVRRDMATLEHSIEVNLSPREVIDEWREFPFRSILGYFREPGRRLHWQDGAGNEAWGSMLVIGLGAERSRICVKLDYYPSAQGISATALDAHVSADLTMFTRFVDSDAARQAARKHTLG
jgi:hypothetical protein